jgi:sugar phosphate permease
MPAKGDNMKKWYFVVIVVVTFLALLVSAGVRTTPSIIIKPLEDDFGWSRSAISFAIAISLFTFGFGAPLGGGLIDRFGPRRVMLGGLALIALGLAPLVSLTELWQLHLLWGLIVGVGTGAISGTLGATVALRWFNQYRGIVLGLFSAASATGQLIFVPFLISLATANGWQSVISAMALIVGLVLIPVVLLMRNRPEEIGLKPYGEAPAAAQAVNDDRETSMREAMRTRDFWLLAASFFICGYTTNGLIGTHLLPHTLEHGFVEAEISAALALMGLMNIVGTLGSGWLSDRYDNRWLLAMYYGFRGLSLMALPFILEIQGMFIFSIIYGLDWIATVPPTVNLTVQRFGRKSLGRVYGWIFCSHMIGAGVASYAGGFFRDWLGDYHLIFLSAAVMGLIASMLSLRISVKPARKQVQPAAA